MNQLVARLAGVISKDIQVSGHINFPESRWREAILFYLFGIWANREDVIYRPKIMFGDITLRLNSSSGEYYAYGHVEVPQDVPPLGPDDLVETSGRQADVEVALIRFVKNDRVKQLRLGVVCDQKVHLAQLVIWKKARRGASTATLASGFPTRGELEGRCGRGRSTSVRSKGFRTATFECCPQQAPFIQLTVPFAFI